MDGQEPIDLSAGDRDMAKVHGQGHQVEITVKDAQKVTHQVHVPLGEDMVLLSLPALLSGAPSSLIPFVPKEIAAPADDQGNNNSFTSPDAPAVPDMARSMPKFQSWMRVAVVPEGGSSAEIE